MLYMVIERFERGRAEDIYQRLAARGRLTPPGLEYVDSWVSVELDCCYQLMRCEDAAVLRQWQRQWEDLVTFETVPVIPSAEARQKVLAARP